MSTTFEWKIANLERETADGFVFTAHYTISAEDGTYTSGAYGSVGFERPDDLIPFDELTEAQVIFWVQQTLNAENPEQTENIQAALQSQLDEKRHPTKASGTPWAS